MAKLELFLFLRMHGSRRLGTPCTADVSAVWLTIVRFEKLEKVLLAVYPSQLIYDRRSQWRKPLKPLTQPQKQNKCVSPVEGFNSHSYLMSEA